MSRSRQREAPWNGQARQDDGVTVYAESEHGETTVFVRAGEPIRDSLQAVCDDLDARPDRWYITVISNPTTIWRDLAGRRAQHGSGNSEQVSKPELRMLAMIGRQDMVRP